jgi:hypothetical protein
MVSPEKCGANAERHLAVRMRWIQLSVEKRRQKMFSGPKVIDSLLEQRKQTPSTISSYVNAKKLLRKYVATKLSARDLLFTLVKTGIPFFVAEPEKPDDPKI